MVLWAYASSVTITDTFSSCHHPSCARSITITGNISARVTIVSTFSTSLYPGCTNCVTISVGNNSVIITSLSNSISTRTNNSVIAAISVLDNTVNSGNNAGKSVGQSDGRNAARIVCVGYESPKYFDWFG